MLLVGRFPHFQLLEETFLCYIFVKLTFHPVITCLSAESLYYASISVGINAEASNCEDFGSFHQCDNICCLQWVIRLDFHCFASYFLCHRILHGESFDMILVLFVFFTYFFL